MLLICINLFIPVGLFSSVSDNATWLCFLLCLAKCLTCREASVIIYWLKYSIKLPVANYSHQILLRQGQSSTLLPGLGHMITLRPSTHQQNSKRNAECNSSHHIVCCQASKITTSWSCGHPEHHLECRQRLVLCWLSEP